MKMDFEKKTLTWDELEVPMQDRRVTAREFMEVYIQSTNLKEAEKRTEEILDAHYEKGDINEAIPEHISDEEKEQLISLLEEFADLFQGKLGTMPGEPYELPL